MTAGFGKSPEMSRRSCYCSEQLFIWIVKQLSALAVLNKNADTGPISGLFSSLNNLPCKITENNCKIMALKVTCFVSLITTPLCYVTGRLGDGVTDTLKAKSNKHSTSRALRKKQRDRLGVCMRESVIWLNTHSSPSDSEEPAIWMQVDEITDTHMAVLLVLVWVISYTHTHTHMPINTHMDTPAYC